MDGPGFYTANGSAILIERQLNVGVLATIFGEDLDARIVHLVARLIVSVDLPVQVNGGSSGRLGFIGDLQVFRQNGLPVIAGKSSSRSENDKSEDNEPENHDFIRHAKASVCTQGCVRSCQQSTYNLQQSGVSIP
jgi:hypothetical protein